MRAPTRPPARAPDDLRARGLRVGRPLLTLRKVLGGALIGRRKGETIDVPTPRGPAQYKIESVNKTAKKTAASKKAS